MFDLKINIWNTNLPEIFLQKLAHPKKSSDTKLESRDWWTSCTLCHFLLYFITALQLGPTDNIQYIQCVMSILNACSSDSKVYTEFNESQFCHATNANKTEVYIMISMWRKTNSGYHSYPFIYYRENKEKYPIVCICNLKPAIYVKRKGPET